MDRAAIGKWNIVWQLVSCRKVRRNVSAVGGMKTIFGTILVATIVMIGSFFGTERIQMAHVL